MILNLSGVLQVLQHPIFYICSRTARAGCYASAVFMEIIGALDQFEQNRFIASLQARHYTPFQIEQTLDMIRSYQARMNMEARALMKFSESFIQEFATDNNKCFTEAQRYFNRIRSTLCALKKVFQKTTPRSMAQLPEGAKQPTVFDRSPLSYGACVIDMYGLASYDEVVQQLYHELETLLTTATATLALCHQMIENEAVIRQDVQLLKSIYQNSCQQLLSGMRDYADLMDPLQVPETELDRRKAKARSMDDFLKSEYHNVAKKEFRQFVWLEAVRQGQNNGMTEEETYLLREGGEGALGDRALRHDGRGRSAWQVGQCRTGVFPEVVCRR